MCELCWIELFCMCMGCRRYGWFGEDWEVFMSVMGGVECEFGFLRVLGGWNDLIGMRVVREWDVC